MSVSLCLELKVQRSMPSTAHSDAKPAAIKPVVDVVQWHMSLSPTTKMSEESTL